MDRSLEPYAVARPGPTYPIEEDTATEIGSESR
jgi:hypothetical protein